MAIYATVTGLSNSELNLGFPGIAETLKPESLKFPFKVKIVSFQGVYSAIDNRGYWYAPERFEFEKKTLK